MNEVFVGEEAPNFKAKAIMSNNSIEDNFDLKEYANGEKIVVFFYPLNFTFVCPSEIIAFDNRLGEFTSRNTKVVGVSIDSHFSHLAYKNTPHNKGGIGNIQYPLVSDITKDISMDYRVLNDDGVALRGTFFIDENFVLRHMLVNDLPLGRSVDEMLRLIDAWDHHTEYGEVCPAGWAKGKEGMTASSEGVTDYLSSNAEKLG